MSLKIKGTIKVILKAQKGKTKAGDPWKTQDFIIDTGAEYNPLICVNVFGQEKIDQFNEFAEGEKVEININLSSKEFEGKYYNSIGGWKIKAATEA